MELESFSTWNTKLYNSSCDGDIEGVIAALAQGGMVTMRSPQGFDTPLLAAAHYGYADICGLLLAHGSKVKKTLCLSVNEMIFDTKATALHLAAVKGHNASIEALLSWGAEVNPQDHAGFTPLNAACQEGRGGRLTSFARCFMF